MTYLKTLFVIVGCIPFTAVAFDASRAWLPSKYQKYHVDLLESIKSAESVDRCETVLDATIDLDQSTDDHPIFRILCRQENGRSYNEMVDGISFKTMTSFQHDREDLTDVDKAILKRKKHDKAQSIWAVCKAQIEKKTSMMASLIWITQGDPKPLKNSNDLYKGEVVFGVDFDAKSASGAALQYQAVCTGTNRSDVKVKMKKRD